MTGDSSKQYTYTGLKDGQTYWIRVVVTDNAGNVGKSAEDNGGTQIATPSANTPPYNASTSCSSKTTTSMTITARAYDNDSPIQTLTYKLYWNGSSSVYDTKTGTSGNSVTFNTVTGLREYTTQTYSWIVEINDGHGGSTRVYGSGRTYCSGRTNSCIVNGESCSNCKGTGFGCKSCGSAIVEIGWNETGKHCGVCGNGLPNWGTVYRCVRWCVSTGYFCEFNTSCREAALANVRSTCSTCGGSGKNTCEHGNTQTHYWCSHNKAGVQH